MSWMGQWVWPIVARVMITSSLLLVMGKGNSISRIKDMLFFKIYYFEAFIRFLAPEPRVH